MSDSALDIATDDSPGRSAPLIDAVERDAGERLTCRASTGSLEDHPFGRGGALPATALAEFAAQAASVHAGRRGETAERPSHRLAACPELRLRIDRLTTPAELVVRVERIGRRADGEHYRFAVEGKGETLAEGRLVIEATDR